MIHFEIEDENLEKISIRNPTNEQVQGMISSYLAPCNGVYSFEVDYLKDGIAYHEVYYVNVMESDRMDDENPPSKRNGFIALDSGLMQYSDEAASGNIYIKLYPYNAHVDGEDYGPGNYHYIAYMQDENANAVLCLNPHLTAASRFEDYDDVQVIDYASNEWVQGKNSSIEHRKLALIWYYGSVAGRAIGNQGINTALSNDEWIFVTQLLLWEALGYPYASIAEKYEDAIEWIRDKIDAHESFIVSQNKNTFEIYVNEPFTADVETVCYYGGSEPDESYRCYGGYIDMNGKTNQKGHWEALDTSTSIRFNHPAYLSYGGNNGAPVYHLIEVLNDENDASKGTHLEVDSVQGGSIFIRNKESITNPETMKDESFSYEIDWTNFPKELQVFQGNSEGYARYEFVLKENITSLLQVSLSWTGQWVLGDSYLYQQTTGQKPYQPLMQFKLPLSTALIKTLYFSNEEMDIPEQNKPEINKKQLVAPSFKKIDEEDGFGVEGAVFDFYSNENFYAHFQRRNAIYAGMTSCGDDPDCTPEAIYEWGEWKDGGTSTVFSKNEKILDGQVSDADGKIYTDEIIELYYEQFEEVVNKKYDSSNPILEAGGFEYRLDPAYENKEGRGWSGGRFYAKESRTSQHQFNSHYSTSKSDYVGYTNPYPWEKLDFQIQEDKGQGEIEIIHENKRQKGRFTVHKVDAEKAYLNHNNNHEAQGDGYFYGTVFLVIAKEDILLHDGSYALSPLSGKPLRKGEIADVLWLKETATATTRLLDLGKYAIQEIRLPGVYQLEPQLEFNDKEQNWQVKYQEELITAILDKNSKFYYYDYDKAISLFEQKILPISSPDGGYWYKDYRNELANPYQPIYLGGPTYDINNAYSKESYVYNEILPSCFNGKKDIFINQEKVVQTIPEIAVTDDLKENVHIVEEDDLDYGNHIQKGHLQLQKMVKEQIDLDQDDNNQGIVQNLNKLKDIYFGIYLKSKISRNDSLPDKYFAQKRMDGLEYIYDADGNFKWFILKDEKWVEANQNEIKENKALICVQTYDGAILPADNYYEKIPVESVIHENPSAPLSYMHYEMRNIYRNPTAGFTSSSQALSDKNLYMVVKTNQEGEAGSNQPLSIVYSNFAQVYNTVNENHYGAYDYQIGLNYDCDATMDLSYLQESGLPLPYGEYFVQELNPQKGYEKLSFEFRVDKNLTTYDRFSETSTFENGIEKDADKVHHIFGKQQPEYVDKQYNQLNWEVKGEGIAKDETWLNKQFHIFKDMRTTTSSNGELAENKLHKQRLRILKKDATTSYIIETGETEFVLWQWNERLAVDNQNHHAIYFEGEWIPYIEWHEFNDKGEIINTLYYGEEEREIKYKGHTLSIQDDEHFMDINGKKGSIGQWITTNHSRYFETKDGEVLLDSYLPEGSYFIMETKAPKGYVLKQEPVAFEIKYNQHFESPDDYIEIPLRDENNLFVCKEAYPSCNDETFDLSHVMTSKVDAILEFILEFENEPQMGYVEILKQGEKFKGFEQYFTPSLQLLAYRPIWGDVEPLPFKAKFAIYAQEDILVNQHLKYSKGECVQIIETDQNGHGASQPLYLGKYDIKELEAPNGYISDGKVHSFELTYDNQLHRYIPNYQSIDNQRQTVQFNIYKEIEALDGTYFPAENAIFGIFADENLLNLEAEDFSSLIPNKVLKVEDMIVERNLKDSNTLNLLGLTNQKNSRFIIPNKIEFEGKILPITQIASYAFADTEIESVILPNTIESIGEGAFFTCNSLKYLEFSSKKSPYFGGMIFDDDHLLTSIVIPANTVDGYDLAFIDGTADGNGIKDGRLMGLPLIDNRNSFDEDEEFTISQQGNSFHHQWSYDDEFEYEDFKQTLMVEDEIFEIQGLKLTGVLNVDQQVAVPSSIDGKKVVALDDGLFKEKVIKEIILPSTIGFIGDSTFSNNEQLNKLIFYKSEFNSNNLFIHENALDFTANFKGFDLIEENPSYLDNAFIISDNGIIQDATLDGHLRWNFEALDPITYEQGTWEYSEEGELALLNYPITSIILKENDLDEGISVNPEQPYPTKWLAKIEKDTLLEEIVIVNGVGESKLDYPQGKYYVKELSAPNGYWLDERKYPVEFNSDGNEPILVIDVNEGLPIINYPIDHWSVRIRIHKTDETNKPLKNAEFILWDETRQKILDYLKTDNNGSALSNSFLEVESDSIFWLQEIKAPEGYEIANEWIKLTKDGIGEFNNIYWDIHIINYVDTPPIEGGSNHECVILGNKILDNNIDKENLRKVSFGIYADEDIFEDGRLIFKKDELIKTTDTAEDGAFSIYLKNLPKGKYYVKEISTASGYQLDESKYSFTYDKKNKKDIININNGKPIINYQTSKSTFEIQILKVDHDKKIPLSGVLFGLYSQPNEEMFIESKVSDENGKIVFNNCLPGYYYIKELKAKDGYFLNEEWIEVEIKNKNIELTLSNRKEKIYDQYDDNPPYTGVSNLKGFQMAWFLSIILLVLIILQKKKS